MTVLLSKAAYADLAATLELRTQAFIDGAFVAARSGQTFATTNPATGAELAQVAACGAADVDAAVAAAKTAFEDGRWSGSPRSTTPPRPPAPGPWPWWYGSPSAWWVWCYRGTSHC